MQLLALPDKLRLLPAERHPTTRAAADVPEEGVLEVAGLKEMGELASALTERAEVERREREAMYSNDDTSMADTGGGGQSSAPAYPPASRGGAGGGPEAPPEMDEEDD